MARSDDNPTREPQPQQTEQPTAAALSMARITQQLEKTFTGERKPQWAVELRKFQEGYKRAVEWLKVNEPDGVPLRPAPPPNNPDKSAESIPLNPTNVESPSVAPPEIDLSEETPEMRWCVARAQSPEILAEGFTSGAKLAEQVLKDYKKACETNDDMEKFHELKNAKHLRDRLKELRALPPKLMNK
jgi:hypothetical protein